MSKYLKYGIPEDIDIVRRIPIGHFWGVKLLITPYVWLGPFIFFSLHILLNLLNRQLSLIEHMYEAMLFTISAVIATGLHAFGHILSGKIAHSPMDELLIASTRDVNLYHGDQSLVSGSVHLVRSLGGPILNLFVAGVCILFLPIISQSFWSALFASFISTNLFFGLGSFFPVPSVDGEVIWREILQLIRIRLQKKN